MPLKDYKDLQFCFSPRVHLSNNALEEEKF